MLLPRATVDSRNVRHTAVMLSVGLALTAMALAVAPSMLARHHARAPLIALATTFVYAIPVTGGLPRSVRVLKGQWGFPQPTADGQALVLEKPLLDRTELWRVPLDGGPLVRAGSLRVFSAPRQRGRFRASVWHTMHHGVLTVHNPDGSVAWRHAVPPQTWLFSVAPDGRSVALLRNEGIELLQPRSARYLVRGTRDIEPAFSPDGKTVYALRVKLATSIPK
jgi:hypothetical protein